MTKYHNIRTPYKGHMYDSKGEAEYAMKLDLRVAAGELVDWANGQAIAVDDRCMACNARPGEPCRGPKGPMAGFHRDRMTYTPDFEVYPKEGRMYYVDFKGLGRSGKRVTETPLFRTKVRQWRKNIPHELRVAYRTGEEKVVATGNEARPYKDFTIGELQVFARRMAP